MKALALFDFDGTITRKDSLNHFLKVSFSKSRYFRGLLFLLPVLIAYKTGLMRNDKAKEQVLIHFFKEMPESRFLQLGKDYAETHLRSILRPDAVEKLQWHREQKHDIWIVTASITEWLKPWTDAEGFNLLASFMEKQNGFMTGKLAGENNFGDEKVRRIKTAIDLSAYHEIYAYGDTPGDLPMLDLATHKGYQVFVK